MVGIVTNAKRGISLSLRGHKGGIGFEIYIALYTRLAGILLLGIPRITKLINDTLRVSRGTFRNDKREK